MLQLSYPYMTAGKAIALTMQTFVSKVISLLLNMLSGFLIAKCMKVKSESEVTQSCPTLHDPMDCSPPGSSVHGIFQARVLEWVAIAFSANAGWCSSKEFVSLIRLHHTCGSSA